MQARRLATAIVMGSVTAALVVGCSSGGTTVTPGSTSSAAVQSQSAPTRKPLDQYVLQVADIPDGYTEQPISPEAKASVLSSLIGAARGAKITPARCQPDASAMSLPSSNNVGTAAFVDPNRGSVIASSAVLGAPSLAEYAAVNFGACTTHTVVATIQGQTSTTSVTSTRLNIPVPGIRDALVFSQSARTSLPGMPITTSRALTALFEIDGVSITLGVRPLTAQAQPDRALFARLVAVAARRALS